MRAARGARTTPVDKEDLLVVSSIAITPRMSTTLMSRKSKPRLPGGRRSQLRDQGTDKLHMDGQLAVWGY